MPQSTPQKSPHGEEDSPRLAPLHGPFQLPEDIRDGDAALAKVLLQGAWKDFRLWRYSPFGLELAFSERPVTEFQMGEELAVKVLLGADETLLRGVVVAPPQREGDLYVVGLRIFIPEAAREPGAQRRRVNRWACPPEFLPLGVAPHPIRFNDFIRFRVSDISAGGLRLITSMRNKLTYVGQRLDATITLPMVGSVHARLIVRHIETQSVGGKEVLALGTELVGADEGLKASLAEYLLHFSHGVTLVSLAKDGFPVRSASKWLDFNYVKTPEEFREVQELRLRTQKAGAGKTAAEMTDALDARSRILAVKHKGRVVGSLRALFHDEVDGLEIEQYVPIPKDFHPRGEIVEASWTCLDPDFKGADLLQLLLSHLLLTAIKTGRRHIVGWAPTAQLELFERFGYRRLKDGKTLVTPQLPGVEQCIIELDAYKVALGQGISLQAWNALYGDVVDYLLTNSLISPNPYQLFKMNLRRALGNLFSRRKRATTAPGSLSSDEPDSLKSAA